MRKISVFILGIFIAGCGSAEASLLGIVAQVQQIVTHVRTNETWKRAVVDRVFTSVLHERASAQTIRPQDSTSLTWVGGMGGTPNAWNQSLNWAPNGIPSGSDVTANFDNTGAVTTINVNAPATTPVTPVTIGTIVFASNSPAYTFNTTGVLVTDPASLTISGAGIINNSSNVQTFNAANTSGGSPTYGRIVFSGDATISGPVTFVANGSYSEVAGPIDPFDPEVIFTDDSSAGSNQTTINIAGGLGAVLFQDDASAGSATINDNSPGGYTFFIGNSTAGNATLNVIRGGVQTLGTSTLGDATVNITAGAFFVEITGNSTAGNATINNAGPLSFFGSATGGTATIIQSAGTTNFADSSNAQNAKITINGGLIQFVSTATTATTGIAPNAGNATIAINAGGTLAFNPPSASPNATAPAPTAGDAQITNAGIISFYTSSNGGGATITNLAGGTTTFTDSSDAGTATITNNAGGITNFFGNSTADQATLNNSGTLNFSGASTGNTATITTNSGAITTFGSTSTGGNATFVTNTSGVVDISTLSSNGMTAGSIAGSGNYDLGSKRLTVGSNNTSTTVDGVIADGGAGSGTGGSLVKVGIGILTLNGNDTYTGGTIVANGAVVVGDPTHATAALSGGGPIVIGINGTLGGYGSVTGNVTNNGTLTAGNSSPGNTGATTGQFTIDGDLFNNALIDLASDPIIGNALLVNGNYTGAHNATLQLNTYMNAGGPLSEQTTDRLLIAGNASGNTAVHINPSGPGSPATGLPNADDGISIIQVGGVSSTNTFTLPGGSSDLGTPYEYELNAYGPGSPNGPAEPSQTLVGNPGTHWDYRLQTIYIDDNGTIVTPGPIPTPSPSPSPPPLIRPEDAPQVPSYLTAPVALFNSSFQDIDSLHRRLGELRDDQLLGINPNSEMYLRGYGTSLNYTSNVGFVGNGFNSSQSYAAIQLGFNWIALTKPAGTLRLGVAGTQGWLSFSPLAVDGHSYSNFTTQTLAGTITWQSRHGWYLDGIVMSGIFNGTVNTEAAQTARLNGTSVQGSLEAGYPFHIGPHGLELEPQVQFIYQHLNFPVITDADGMTVDLGNPDQGIFRGGFRLIRPTTGPNGAHFTPYFNADVLQGIGTSPVVRFENIPFDAGYFGSAVQVGAGITGTLSNNFSAHADVSWMQSIGSDGGIGASGFRGWAYNGELRWTF